MEEFANTHPVVLALLATTFTWLVTASGAALVFLFKEIPRKALDGMLGFTGGVMIAASYWSLLAPSIELSRHWAISHGCPRRLVLADVVFLFLFI